MPWLIFFVMICLIALFACYYYHLVKRFILVFHKNYGKRDKFIAAFLGVVLALLSADVFSIIGIFMLHFFFFSLLLDLFFVIIGKIRPRNDTSIVIKIYKTSLLAFVLTIAIFGYGYLNIRDVRETKYTLYTEKEVADTRILLITDVHYGTIFGDDKLAMYKKRLNDVGADIIVLGGDIVDESTTISEMHNIFQMLGSLNNTKGIYYVHGNHDERRYFGGQTFSEEEIEKTLEDNHITLLDEKSVQISDALAIVGRRDYSYGTRKSVTDLLQEVNRGSYVIMVDHQPLDYDENISAGTDLILSGHTHGGQVFPIKFFIDLLHTSDLSYGHKNYGVMDAIVSSGMAGWGYPIRTEGHSEYVVIDIKKK